MDEKTLKTFLFGLGIGAVVVGAFFMGGVASRLGWMGGSSLSGKQNSTVNQTREIVDEESVVTKVVEKATPSVVTVSISKTNLIGSNLPPGWDIFGEFFNVPKTKPVEQKVEQDIGTGFVIEKDGLIVTNKHVVSDTTAKYKVIIGKDQVAEVKNIYRDPTSDLAILKVDKTGLTPVILGDSDQLKVGQTVIAIGTALGEFRSTVTKGVISGLGRGITAGSPLAGSERLDNVIQTDAAINPGNSGGPLFNSNGEAIGVNVAVSQEGQSIGFALPINLVKESIANFKTTGEFERPFLGVGYQMISKQSALLNDVPAGAYVKTIVEGSPAEVAGVKVGDIIVEMDGKKLADEKNASLANMINRKKIGDTVSLKVWRDDKELSLSIKLEKRK
ncbi:MAG: trypsin-like peptidase domain-containing protein [Candidatus Shapirobacteria bacterium]|jgi:S1-C subfamily serine protease